MKEKSTMSWRGIKASRQATSRFTQKRGRMPLSVLVRKSLLPWAARPASCPADVLQSKATSSFQFRPLMAALCIPLFAGWDCSLTGTEDLQSSALCQVQFSCRSLTYFTQSDYWLPSSATSEAECLHCSPSQTWILWWRKSADLSPQLGDTHCLLCICLCPGERKKSTASSTPRPWGWIVGLCSHSVSLARAFETGDGNYLSTAYPFISLKWDQLLITRPMLFSSTFPPSHHFKSKWPFGKSARFHV